MDAPSKLAEVLSSLTNRGFSVTFRNGPVGFLMARIEKGEVKYDACLSRREIDQCQFDIISYELCRLADSIDIAVIKDTKEKIAAFTPMAP